GGFADADELYRQAELPRYRQQDAALGGTVELRDDDAGHADRVMETAGLLQAVLARYGVDHEPYFRGFALVGPAGHALHLLQFFHQVVPRVQAAGRVDEEHVHAAGLPGSG